MTPAARYLPLRELGLAAALLLAPPLFAQTDGDRREWPKTDFSKRTVELAEIESGGPPKDGIPALDRPRFVSTRIARAWLKAKEPVLVLRLGRDARAYPIQILMFHEIVNDTVNDVPVAVTFCPLCNASIVFERRVAGRVLDFGTTGRLRFSDLVMYDRQTESWWQQFTGRGIVGQYAGTVLKQLPSEIVAFEEFETSHRAQGLVLSRETGHSRPYGRNPYAGYDRIDQSPFLFSGKLDARLPPMERVLSVSAGGKHRLYPLSLLEHHPVSNRELGSVPYVVFARTGMVSPLDADRIEAGRSIAAATAFDRRIEGRTLEFAYRDGRWVDGATGSHWNLLGEAVAGPLKGKRLAAMASGVHFAFAWLAFNPDSEIVRSL
ncbi:MAG: DUF3179 domain-containing protein [Betaproteobacteria bacterium]|nr:MAG: DUF3179 domain-containing protein [Betaproteobacteria bacterium]